MIDSELLKRFYVVTQSKNLTEAAKKLGLVQASVSNSIAALEAHLNTPLFSRTHSGLVVNSKGLELCEHIKRLEEETEIFKKKFFDDDENMQGELSLVTFPYVGSELLVPLLKDFMELYPELKIKILIDAEHPIPTHADVAIGSYIDRSPTLIQEELLPLHNQLFASKKYVERFGLPQDPKDLYDHRIIIYTDARYHSLYRNSNLAFEIQPPYAKPLSYYFEIASLNGMIKAILEGYGIGELPIFPNVLELDLVPVLPEYSSAPHTLYYIYRKGRSSSQKIIALKNFLQARLRSRSL